MSAEATLHRPARRSACAHALAVACGLLMAATAASEAPAQRRPGSAEIVEGLVGAAPPDAFERPSGPWRLDLPADHAPHPEARAESWTLAAHLEDTEGRALGLQFAVARFGLRGPDDDAPSPWTAASLRRAHLILAEADGAPPRAEERIRRGTPGAPGDDRAGGVGVDDWTLSPGGDGTLTLAATLDGAPLRLALAPAKPARPAGGGDEAPLRGYAMPRMNVEGTIGRGAGARAVTGVAWLDHLWGELPLPGGAVAYDRLLLQLDDGRDLALVRSRRRGGRGAATVDATLVGPDGTSRTLATLSMDPAARWEDADGTAYPVDWRIEGDTLSLKVTAVRDDQRHRGFALPLWSGLVRAEGRIDGAPASGFGTLQLTGYGAE